MPAVNPYQLGELFKGEADLLAEAGVQITPNMHPYEVLRQIQAKRADHPGLDSVMKQVDAAGFSTPIAKEAPGGIATFAKTGLNALALGIPDYVARKTGIGLDPLTDEETSSTAGMGGEVAGTLAGFFVPGGILRAAGGVSKLGRLGQMAGKAGNILKSGQKAGEVLGAGSKINPWIAHGLGQAAVGAAQGVSRGARTQAQQITETGKRKEGDWAPLAAEAVGNALVMPYGGAAASKAIGALGLGKWGAKGLGALAGFGKQYGGMSTLSAAQHMSEDPSVTFNQGLKRASSEDLPWIAGALGGAAGLAGSKFLTPALSAKYASLSKVAPKVQAETPAAVNAAEKLAVTDAPVIAQEEEALRAALGAEEVTDPSTITRFRQLKNEFTPASRTVAYIKNVLATAGAGTRDALKAASAEPRFYDTPEGLVAEVAGRGNRFGQRAGAVLGPQAQTAKRASLKNVSSNAKGKLLEYAGRVWKFSPEMNIESKPYVIDVGGKKVTVVATSPELAIGFDEAGQKLNIPLLSTKGTESLGAESAKEGSDLLGTAVQDAIQGRRAAREAKKMQPVEQRPMTVQPFRKLTTIIANIMSQEGAEEVIPALVAENPDMAGAIKAAVKLANPAMHKQIFPAKPRLRVQ